MASNPPPPPTLLVYIYTQRLWMGLETNHVSIAAYGCYNIYYQQIVQTDCLRIVCATRLWDTQTWNHGYWQKTFEEWMLILTEMQSQFVIDAIWRSPTCWWSTWWTPIPEGGLVYHGFVKHVNIHTNGALLMLWLMCGWMTFDLRLVITTNQQRQSMTLSVMVIFMLFPNTLFLAIFVCSSLKSSATFTATYCEWKGYFLLQNHSFHFLKDK